MVSATAEAEARLEKLRVTGNRLSCTLCDGDDLKVDIRESIQKTEEQWSDLLLSVQPRHRWVEQDKTFEAGLFYTQIDFAEVKLVKSSPIYQFTKTSLQLSFFFCTLSALIHWPCFALETALAHQPLLASEILLRTVSSCQMLMLCSMCIKLWYA